MHGEAVDIDIDQFPSLLTEGIQPGIDIGVDKIFSSDARADLANFAPIHCSVFPFHPAPTFFLSYKFNCINRGIRNNVINLKTSWGKLFRSIYYTTNFSDCSNDKDIFKNVLKNLSHKSYTHNRKTNSSTVIKEVSSDLRFDHREAQNDDVTDNF